FEVNEAAEIIRSVAHPDANIIYGQVIDDSMGGDVRVTVIASGFESWEGSSVVPPARERVDSGLGLLREEEEEPDLDFDDEFDVPDFLK
ncbi:MAG: cell division protein FtsZ, partial [Acidimicrobiales bacterium]